jgi:hypothetical protein
MGTAEDPNMVKFGISTLSIIATITDILIGDRLAFSISDGKDEKEGPKDTILGVQWFYENEKKVKEKIVKEKIKQEGTKDAL